MKKITTACLACCLFTLNTFSQQEPAFVKMQKEFEEWSQGKDLSKEKGWKWYKRWEDQMVRRANADGSLPGEYEYFKAASEVAAIKEQQNRTAGAAPAWVPVGPFNVPGGTGGLSSYGIGRINTIAFHPTDANTFWVGVAQGGVWKTTNGGQSYMPLTDNLPVLRISDIAVDPQHPDTMYISVCDYGYIGVALETDGRKRNTHYGMGVYKTTDGGQSWNPTGLAFNQTDFDGSLIRRTFISSSNSDELLAAGTSGIWKSSNGGTNWTKVLDSLIWDIERDPVNKNILYASGGYVSRINKGTACILKSSDFGNTWTLLNTGIPGRGSVQRVELAISPSNPNYVYALNCNTSSGFHSIYRTINGGTSWSQRSTTPNILGSSGTSSGGQGTYDLTIVVNSSDPNTIYTGGIVIWGSSDGGMTMTQITGYNTIHPDQHFFACNPLNQKYYLCNDGGLYETASIVLDLTSTPWQRISDGMQIPSYYRLGTSKNNDGYLIAGAQDNGTVYYDGNQWAFVNGGDGMDCVIDNDDPKTFIASSQFGNFEKSTDGGQTSIALAITNESGEWTTPIVRDPVNNNILYAGYINIHKSTDNGDTWSPISSLTGPPVTAIAVSPANASYIYFTRRVQSTTMTNAQVWMTTNGGNTWKDITAGLPDTIYPTSIITGDTDPKIAWVTYGGFYSGVKVYKTTDGGTTWTNISYNLPNLPVNTIVHQNGTADNVLYVGCDVGVYKLREGQSSWQLESTGLPNVIVSDLEIHYKSKKLFAATFGRGIWSLDLPDSGTSTGNKLLARTEMKIYPSVNRGEFTLSITQSGSDKGNIEIIDISGRKIVSEEIFLTQGAYSQNYKLKLSFGLYFLKLSLPNGESLVERFIVSR